MKATEQYFPVVLFIMPYKVVLTFESVDEILKCDHSNESYWAVLSCGAVYFAVQGGPNFWVCGWNPKVWPFKWKLLSSTFLWCCFLCCFLLLALNLRLLASAFGHSLQVCFRKFTFPNFRWLATPFGRGFNTGIFKNIAQGRPGPLKYVY